MTVTYLVQIGLDGPVRKLDGSAGQVERHVATAQRWSLAPAVLRAVWQTSGGPDIVAARLGAHHIRDDWYQADALDDLDLLNSVLTPHPDFEPEQLAQRARLTAALQQMETT